MTREQLFERLNETCQELSGAEVERDELRQQMRTLRDACADFRDSVLNSRHQLAESSLDNDQTNAVLGAFR